MVLSNGKTLEEKIMLKLKGAISVLKKEAEFLGMTFEEVLVFIERNPYAASKNALVAYEICRKEFV